MFKLFSASFLVILFFTLPASAATYSVDFTTDGSVNDGAYAYTYGEGKLSITSFNPENAVVRSSVGLGVENNYLDMANEGFLLQFAQDVFNLKFTFSNWDDTDAIHITDGSANIGCVSSCESNFPVIVEDGSIYLAGPISKLYLSVPRGADATSTSLLSASWETSDLVATPLPAALPLYAAGMGLMGFLGWRKRRKFL